MMSRHSQHSAARRVRVLADVLDSKVRARNAPHGTNAETATHALYHACLSSIGRRMTRKTPMPIIAKIRPT
jgi:plasmid stability protein